MIIMQPWNAVMKITSVWVAPERFMHNGAFWGSLERQWGTVLPVWRHGLCQSWEITDLETSIPKVQLKVILSQKARVCVSYKIKTQANLSCCIFVLIKCWTKEAVLKLTVTVPSVSLLMWNGHAVDITQKQKCSSFIAAVYHVSSKVLLAKTAVVLLSVVC